MTIKKIFFLTLFLIFTTTAFPDELLQRGEAYIFTESSWKEAKALEKKAFKETKKERRLLKKKTAKKIREAEKKPVRYVNSDGNVFINNLYQIKIANEYNGDILVSVDKGPEQKLESSILILREGMHQVKYKLLDQKGNTREEKEETIFLDLTRPEINAQLEGVYFEKNSFYYYKPGVKLFLQARDSESGIDDIFINQNKKGYLPYNQIFQPIDKPGLQEIIIVATDKVTNLSQEVYLRYAVDSEPPVVDIELNTIPELHSNRGNVCDPDTSIRLSAFDMGSGVSRIEYRKRGSKVWKVYRDYPLVSVKKKKLAIEYRAIDNLGNESEIKYFKCKVKNETQNKTGQ